MVYFIDNIILSSSVSIILHNKLHVMLQAGWGMDDDVNILVVCLIAVYEAVATLVLCWHLHNKDRTRLHISPGGPQSDWQLESSYLSA